MSRGSVIVKEEPKIPKVGLGEVFEFEDRHGCFRFVRICFCL